MMCAFFFFLSERIRLDIKPKCKKITGKTGMYHVHTYMCHLCAVMPQCVLHTLI